MVAVSTDNVKDRIEDVKKKNVRALQEFRMKLRDPDDEGKVYSRKVTKGEVIAKADFPSKGDYLNLLHMPKPRLAETSDRVGKAKTSKADTGMPGA
jgi:hypothetical protein